MMLLLFAESGGNTFPPLSFVSSICLLAALERELSTFENPSQ
jgi:hypothetical protein